MNTQDIEDILDGIAVDVMEMHTRIGSLGTVLLLTAEGEECSRLSAHVMKIEPVEIACGDYVSSTSEHDLSMAVLKQAIKLMPSNRSILYWRVRPEYSKGEDLRTGRQMHKIYTRLTWVSEEDWERLTA